MAISNALEDVKKLDSYITGENMKGYGCSGHLAVY